MIFDHLLYLSVESLFSKQDMYTITITMPQEHIPVLFDSYSEVIVFTNTRWNNSFTVFKEARSNVIVRSMNYYNLKVISHQWLWITCVIDRLQNWLLKVGLKCKKNSTEKKTYVDNHNIHIKLRNCRHQSEVCWLHHILVLFTKMLISGKAETICLIWTTKLDSYITKKWNLKENSSYGSYLFLSNKLENLIAKFCWIHTFFIILSKGSNSLTSTH